jgi:hypothetical protein
LGAFFFLSKALAVSAFAFSDIFAWFLNQTSLLAKAGLGCLGLVESQIIIII